MNGFQLRLRFAFVGSILKKFYELPRPWSLEFMTLDLREIFIEGMKLSIVIAGHMADVARVLHLRFFADFYFNYDLLIEVDIQFDRNCRIIY